VKVSVITASFNSAATIDDTLASVQAQQGVEIEHLVIDGASRDGTQECVRRFPHVARLVSEPDRGIYDALNKGLALSTGDVVGFLHTDDFYAAPDVLQAVAAAFADPAVEVVYGDLVYVHKDDVDRAVRYWRAGEFSTARLRRGWMPPHPTLYVRRDVYERIGLFDVSYRIAADYDSVLRIFSRLQGKAVCLPRVMVKMRVGGASNRSLANVVRKTREDYRALRRHGVGGVWCVLLKNLSKLNQFGRATRLETATFD
jgi:glycosyltransferase involved in cell wall biosynthesis